MNVHLLWWQRQQTSLRCQYSSIRYHDSHISEHSKLHNHQILRKRQFCNPAINIISSTGICINVSQNCMRQQDVSQEALRDCMSTFLYYSRKGTCPIKTPSGNAAGLMRLLLRSASSHKKLCSWKSPTVLLEIWGLTCKTMWMLEWVLRDFVTHTTKYQINTLWMWSPYLWVFCYSVIRQMWYCSDSKGNAVCNRIEGE
jgi:hypothetical protein